MTDLLRRALTKAERARRVRAILHDGPLGPVPEVDGDWLIWEVFVDHPRFKEKAKGGVERVEIRSIPPFNSRAFFLVHSDGTAVDISFRESLNPSKHMAKVHAAARWEVERDVRVWKIKNPSPDKGMHCDHVVPFDQLWRDFIATHMLQEEHISVVSDPTGSNDYFENRKLSHSWQRYHFERATFQWLTAESNIAKSNKVEPEDLAAAA